MVACVGPSGAGCDGALWDMQDNNAVVRTWGEPRKEAKYNHVDLVHMLGIADLERGGLASRFASFGTP